MGTLQKSQKHHKKSVSYTHLRAHETRSNLVCRLLLEKKNSTPFSAIYLVLVVKIVFRIVIFRKILDGDPTKITKMSRNIDQHRVIAEKP